MEKDLIKFYDYIEKINKDVCKYVDDKGNYFLIPTSQLLVNCEYKELDKKEYDMAVFQMEVPKDLELNEIDTTRARDKYSITKIEADKGTIIEAEIKAKQVWIVKNGILKKAFNSKDEAIKCVEDINKKVFEMAEI